MLTMKIMQFTLPMLIGATITVLLIDRVQSTGELTVAKIDPLICGTPKHQQFVEDWVVRNNYVVDLTHGGVYESWFCRPIDKDMAINTGIGRD